MKVFIGISIIAAAALLSAVSEATDEPNWVAVRDKVNEFEKLVTETVHGIIETAKRDKTIVGIRIGMHFSKGEQEANNLMTNTQHDVDGKSLRLNQINKRWYKATALYGKVKGDVETELPKLAESVAKGINQTMVTAYEQGQKLVNEVVEIIKKYDWLQ